MSTAQKQQTPPAAAPTFELRERTTAELDRRFRELQAEDAKADLVVGWLSDQTIDPLLRATTVLGDELGVRLAGHAGPYGQHFQQLLDPASDMLQRAPDVLVLSLSLRQLAPELVYGQGNLSAERIAAECDRVIDTVERWMRLALEKSAAQLLICNFIRPPTARFGVADPVLEAGEQRIYAELNSRLATLCRSESRATVIDAHHAAACAGLADGWNPRMYHLAKIEWGPRVTLHIAERIARACRALTRPARKCLVVDLDNTLWGGVLGEDGPQGIRIGQGDPVGEAFLAFQHALLDLKARGIVLAIASKNNRADVEEAFTLRDEMPLSLDDFAYAAIDWQPKHANIEGIAKALNIGIDALAFIDDNPVECELVRQALPEVLTLQVPQDVSALADLLYRVPDFDKLRLSEEDAQKTRQYADNFKRQEHQQSVSDMTAFLESLETRVTIRPAIAGDRTRIHQLFTKTNQFNVTTIRYTASDIDAFIADDATHLHTIRATDKFGDLGMIGLYLLRHDADSAEIDSFVMSCRALGRGIETAAANALKQLAFERLGVASLSARFIATKKNAPAADFFERQGFTKEDGPDTDGDSYSLEAAASQAVECPGITIDYKDNNDE